MQDLRRGRREICRALSSVEAAPGLQRDGAGLQSTEPAALCCRKAAAADAASKQADLKEAVAGYKEDAEEAAAEAKRLLKTLKYAGSACAVHCWAMRCTRTVVRLAVTCGDSPDKGSDAVSDRVQVELGLCQMTLQDAPSRCRRTAEGCERRGAEKGASGKQRAASKERARLDQARAAVEAAVAELEAAQRAEQEATAIAKESAAEVRCVAAPRGPLLAELKVVEAISA